MPRTIAPTPNHELNMKLELQDPLLPLEHCVEYDAAAEYFARHNKLPDCMGSPGAIADLGFTRY